MKKLHLETDNAIGEQSAAQWNLGPRTFFFLGENSSLIVSADSNVENDSISIEEFLFEGKQQQNAPKGYSKGDTKGDIKGVFQLTRRKKEK